MNWLRSYGQPDRKAIARRPSAPAAPAQPLDLLPHQQPLPVIVGAWKAGSRRVLVEAIACEACGSTDMTRREACPPMVWFRCNACGKRQKEPEESGRCTCRKA